MKNNRTFTLMLLAMTFFTWGLLTSANSILVPHFQELFNLNYKQSMFVQIAFYLAPFLACIPTSIVMNRCGYKMTLSMSLIFTAVGAALFFSAVSFGSFSGSLAAIFILALGVAAMQVVANPYVTQLGEAASASRRLTFTSSINSLGTTLAPLFIGLTLAAFGIANLYLGIAFAVLTLALVIIKSNIQDFKSDLRSNFSGQMQALLKQKNFMLGACTIFVYVGVEVSLGTVTISYLTDENIAALAPSKAMTLISLYWAGSMFGRFVYSAFSQYIEPSKALGISACCASLLIIFAVLNSGIYGGAALILVGLCNSFMYPVIFSKSIEGLGALTGSASAVLIMCGIGGGIVPFIQAVMVDLSSVRMSYMVPLCGYLFILIYSFYSRKNAAQQLYNQEIRG
ncbi:MFS transporter [Psychromonas aquimarina]|uniref:MFS transporter n=1 Tax=Psychromonas aquimarina TaxID=444919 RepID=UPI000400FFFD|nr:MFS transporter [Psychromonas aquimarina]